MSQGRIDEGMPLLDEAAAAADLYRRSGARFETGRAQLALAGVLKALGREEAARRGGEGGAS